jgi:hypothetical protein
MITAKEPPKTLSAIGRPNAPASLVSLVVSILLSGLAKYRSLAANVALDDQFAHKVHIWRHGAYVGCLKLTHQDACQSFASRSSELP